MPYNAVYKRFKTPWGLRNNEYQRLRESALNGLEMALNAILEGFMSLIYNELQAIAGFPVHQHRRLNGLQRLNTH